MNRILPFLCVVSFVSAGTGATAQQSYFRSEVNLGGGACVGSGPSGGKFDMQGIFGVQVSPAFYIGAGMGIQYYGEKYGLVRDKGLGVVPFFIDVKGFVGDGPVSPFLGLDVGWATSVGSAGSAPVRGLYFAPAAGAEIFIPPLGPVTFSVSYQRQEFREKSESYPVDKFRPRWKAEAIVLKVGFVFGSE